MHLLLAHRYYDGQADIGTFLRQLAAGQGGRWRICGGKYGRRHRVTRRRACEVHVATLCELVRAQRYNR